MFENACDESVTFRIQRPEDDEGIVKVLQAAFGHWPRFETGVAPIGHLCWKRLSDPDAGDYHMVAELDGKIVGTQMYMVQDVRVGEQVLRSANGVDICVHPDYQRRGIRRAMLDFAWERVEVRTPFLLMFVSRQAAMNAVTERLRAYRTSFANKMMLSRATSVRGGTNECGRSRASRRCVRRADERVLRGGIEAVRPDRGAERVVSELARTRERADSRSALRRKRAD